MENSPIPYTKHNITPQDIAAVHEVLQSDYITRGPVVERFETALAAYCNSKFAVVVSSGTAALYLAYRVLGLGTEDYILSSPVSFAATMNAALHLKANPCFVDIEPDFFTLDPHKIKIFLEKTPSKNHPKVITGISMAGHPYNMEAIWEIAKNFDVNVVADQSHALGCSWYDSNRDLQFIGNGTYADLEIFSFQATKNITAGEGGAIMTNDKTVYKKLKRLRNHGLIKQYEHNLQRDWEYDMKELGFNFMMTDFQAALGLQQLYNLNNFVERRQQIAAFYDEVFKEDERIKTPGYQADVSHARHLYIIQVGKRDKVYAYLKRCGINCQVHYKPIHLLSYYQKQFEYKKGDFPVSETFFDTALSIPLYPALSDEQVNYCATKIMEAVENISDR